MEHARDEKKKKLYNYVSVYDSHFHYVTINMFRSAFPFLEAISHPRYSKHGSRQEAS